jgi:hypothetical protein
VSLMARWLTTLADDLTAQGWQGGLEHIPDDRRPPQILPTTDQVTMTVDLGLSGWGTTNMQMPVWRTQPSSIPGLVGLAETWLAAVPGPVWLGNMRWCEGTIEEVLRDLRATLTDPESCKSARVFAGTEERLRRAHFSMTGRVGLLDHGGDPVRERLGEMRELLTAWAARLDSLGCG